MDMTGNRSLPLPPPPVIWVVSLLYLVLFLMYTYKKKTPKQHTLPSENNKKKTGPRCSNPLDYIYSPEIQWYYKLFPLRASCHIIPSANPNQACLVHAAPLFPLSLPPPPILSHTPTAKCLLQHGYQGEKRALLYQSLQYSESDEMKRSVKKQSRPSALQWKCLRWCMQRPQQQEESCT